MPWDCTFLSLLWGDRSYCLHPFHPLLKKPTELAGREIPFIKCSSSAVFPSCARSAIFPLNARYPFWQDSVERCTVQTFSAELWMCRPYLWEGKWNRSPCPVVLNSALTSQKIFLLRFKQWHRFRAFIRKQRAFWYTVTGDSSKVWNAERILSRAYPSLK